jgi:2-dehydro-3-deoxygalactonokinase
VVIGMSAIENAKLIGLDWGSTSLRAFLIGGDGLPLETRTGPHGASTLSGADAYVQVLNDIAGDWIAARPDLPLLACGMVGSKHGWKDVPYQNCPANADKLATGLQWVPGAAVKIVPGLLHITGEDTPELMRGEETQIVGALGLDPELAQGAVIVLPGTHSKWAQVAGGVVQDFATYMTGEMFAVLRGHSVLGKLLPETLPKVSSDDDQTDFLRGVVAARDFGDLGLTHQLFAVRSLGVTDKLSSVGLLNYLSGLLIGHELRSALVWRDKAGLTTAPIVLVGDVNLCQRYQLALQSYGQAVKSILPDASPVGLWQVAVKAGLVK